MDDTDIIAVAALVVTAVGIALSVWLTVRFHRWTHETRLNLTWKLDKDDPHQKKVVLRNNGTGIVLITGCTIKRAKEAKGDGPHDPGEEYKTLGDFVNLLTIGDILQDMTT